METCEGGRCDEGRSQASRVSRQLHGLDGEVKEGNNGQIR